MDDLISRQDAIGKIKDWMKFIGYSHSERNVMECTIQMLQELPSAQKTGKWMTPKQYCQYLYETTGERCTPMGTGLESFVYCSQCGEPSWFSKNYCPFCGSRNTGYEEYE